MKIAYVSQEYPPSLRAGGIASYVKEIALGMKARGHEITIITANDDTRKSSDIVEDGIRIIRLNGGNFFLSEIEGRTVVKIIKQLRCFYRFWSYRRKLRDAILRYAPFDLIEVAEFGCEGLYLYDLNIPIVCRLHTPTLMDHNTFGILPFSFRKIHFYEQGLLELKLLKTKTQYITSCSSSLKDWVQQNVFHGKKDIRVIYNPIQYRPIAHLSYNNHHKNTWGILYVGTICDWKGAGDLYQACSILDKKDLNFELTMVGKVGMYSAMLKPTPWLNILGKIKRESVMQFYQQADVVCFPSWWENMPMVCLEAMMCGAIVIGSSSGGMSEIITDGEDGFLLPPQNPELWAAKIEEVLALPLDEKQRISTNAAKKIKAKFSVDVVAWQMEKYYIDVIKDYQMIK